MEPFKKANVRRIPQAEGTAEEYWTYKRRIKGSREAETCPGDASEGSGLPWTEI